MLDGIMLQWFVLAAAAVLFVAIDIRTTPESLVMKWGFVLVTAFTGVVGAFLYVLGCREPLPSTGSRHRTGRIARFVARTGNVVRRRPGVAVVCGAA
jgi:hypothetical protein